MSDATANLSLVDERPVLMDLVARTEPSRVAHLMARRFRAEIPSYRSLPQALVEAEMIELARHTLAAFARSATRGHAADSEEVAAFAHTARQRAAEGFPLEDLLQAHRLGGRILWQALADTATAQERHALAEAADVVMAHVDAASATVTRAYLDATSSRLSQGERHIRDLMAALTSGHPLVEAHRALAERLHFVVQASYRPFLALLPGGSSRAHRALVDDLRGFGLLAVAEDRRVIGLLAPEAPEPIPPPGVRLAAGTPVERAELAESLGELRLLAHLSELDGHRRELSVQEFAPELLLARSPQVAAGLRERLLAPLEAHGVRRGPDLVSTLETLMACDLDRRRAAAALHVHRNTLDYRVRRAAELSGIDLSTPRDLALLWLALCQRRLELAQTAARDGSAACAATDG